MNESKYHICIAVTSTYVRAIIKPWPVPPISTNFAKDLNWDIVGMRLLVPSFPLIRNFCTWLDDPWQRVAGSVKEPVSPKVVAPYASSGAVVIEGNLVAGTVVTNNQPVSYSARRNRDYDDLYGRSMHVMEGFLKHTQPSFCIRELVALGLL
jgi:hypothetical protein